MKTYFVSVYLANKKIEIGRDLIRDLIHDLDRDP